MQVSVDLVPRDRDSQHRGFVLNFQIQMKCAADGGKERESERTVAVLPSRTYGSLETCHLG